MRRYLLAAAAAAAIASPAVARDGSFYVGVEAGAMLVEDIEFDFQDADDEIDDAFVTDHATGIDADLIAGYDFGAVRAEVELGYKRASVNEIAIGNFLGTTGPGVYFDTEGRGSVISGMINLLLDFGDDDGWSGYVGPGVGLARVKYRADAGPVPPLVPPRPLEIDGTDRVLAWQVVAGVRTALTPNIDLGVKYRYFNTGRFRFEEEDGGGVGNPPFELDGKWRSHSLLASLVYNFWSPPPPPVVVPPPPPPPPPPATKTCPDGSVVLATDPCPLPPPPPPPPPPLPERG